MPRASRDVDRYVGILNLDKPRGLTSHDVVDRVRHAIGQRRVGHAGTLDPEATGVLLVLLGQATRASDLLMAGTKQYRAVVRFGATSTTDDAAGEITERGGAIPLDEEIRAALRRFVGEIEQVPPAYSAIKVGGRPLYERARQGRAIEVAPRRVRIDDIDLVALGGRDLTIGVTCSKGTYIRALARDLGEALGRGAYLASLARTASGRFCQTDAVALDDVADAARDGYLDRILYPVDTAAPLLPARFLPETDVQRLRRGLDLAGSSASEGALARGFDGGRGELVAILRATDRSTWHPDLVFPNRAAEGGADDAA